jgi:carbonic anhydrase
MASIPDDRAPASHGKGSSMTGQIFTRRRMLQTLSVAAAGGVGLLDAPWRQGGGNLAQAAGTAAHWSYEGDEGPRHWGQLSPDYKACSSGTRQSPIDLSAAHIVPGSALALSWQPMAATVANNGHTIQVAPQDAKYADSFLELDGKRYTFAQFHFHHPSEHALAGKRWPLEVHFVHKATSGSDLTVIGVLFRPGRANAALGQVLTHMPRKQETVTLNAAIDMTQLLPNAAATYRYLGSLTTPPCSEIVNWVVFRDPIEAGIGQIDQFANLFPMNARPVQPLLNRSVDIDLF